MKLSHNFVYNYLKLVNMDIEQKKFREILSKYEKENMTFFTSNDFHTIWDAIKEYMITKNETLDTVYNCIKLYDYFDREHVQNDKEYMYIFTDNALRTSGNIKISNESWYCKLYGDDRCHGNGTQAVIRGLENAYPITTMRTPYNDQWDDSYLDVYKSLIDAEIEQIKDNYHKYKGIKYSAMMKFGNANISKMKYTAPQCLEYLNKKLLEINIDNR